MKFRRLETPRKTRVGPFLEGPEVFSHPESGSKILNLMITELIYWHLFLILINRGSLYIIRFRLILPSVLRYRLIKIGFEGAICFRGFHARNGPQEREPNMKLINKWHMTTYSCSHGKNNNAQSWLSSDLENQTKSFSVVNVEFCNCV